MYLSADLDPLTRRVGTGTYTVSQDPLSMNPNSKHSYRYVPICGSRCKDEVSRYRYWCGSLDPDSMNLDPNQVSVSESEL